MKKFLIVLSVFIFTTDSFGTGIDANTTTAQCDNETLSKYTGTVNAEINWEPNRIDLYWFDGDTQLSVQSASQSCNYDGLITVPPQPTKLGYTFKGWKVKETHPATTCGVEQLDASRGGTGSTSSLGGNGERDFYYAGDRFGLSQNGTFAIEFSYGVVYGRGRCSSTSGDNNAWNFGVPQSEWIKKISDENGRYCWCQITGFTPVGSDYTKGPSCNIAPVSSWWVFDTVRDTSDNCFSWCAPGCMFRVGGNSTLRAGAYSVAGRQ